MLKKHHPKIICSLCNGLKSDPAAVADLYAQLISGKIASPADLLKAVEGGADSSKSSASNASNGKQISTIHRHDLQYFHAKPYNTNKTAPLVYEQGVQYPEHLRLEVSWF